MRYIHLFLITLFQQSRRMFNITSAAFIILNTALVGNNKPPLCLEQMNLACIVYSKALKECRLSAASNSYDLLTVKPET